jgi:hypothetical protein
VRQNLLVCASAGMLRNGRSRTAARTATRSAVEAAMDWPPLPPFGLVGVGGMGGCACRGYIYIDGSLSVAVHVACVCQDMYIYGRVVIVFLFACLLDSCKGWVGVG